MTAAAWVPYDDARDMDADDELASRAALWMAEQCVAAGARAAVVAHTYGVIDSCRPLVAFAAASERVSMGASTAFGHTFHGPVLALYPDFAAMDWAMRRLRGGPVCVIESGNGPRWVPGWAMELQALDLSTNEVTPDPRSTDGRNLWGQLDLFKQNGYAGMPDEASTRRLLRDVRDADPDLTPGDIAGIALARGASDYGVKNLTKYLEKIAGPRRR